MFLHAEDNQELQELSLVVPTDTRLLPCPGLDFKHPELYMLIPPEVLC